jgi:hypothetical protein
VLLRLIPCRPDQPDPCKEEYRTQYSIDDDRPYVFLRMAACKIVRGNDEARNAKNGEYGAKGFLFHDGCLLWNYKQYAAESEDSVLKHSAFA